MAGAPALEVMDGLPAQQRDAVRARVVDGRASEDIADELRCSPSVVRKRVSRGLEAIRSHMEVSGDA
jgi:RNA polymerase sigma-70 factor, ECF subfamily